MNWPGIEPVGRGTCLNFNLLRSAAEQPYQECFGRELYPTLAAKASYLFVHIAQRIFLVTETNVLRPSVWMLSC